MHGEKRMFQFAFNGLLPRISAVALVCILAGAGFAQNPAPANQAPVAPQPQQFVMKDYSKPRSHFPNPVAPYSAQRLPSPNLQNTPRIEQLMREGKLYLSMNDAVALALENNLDIAIQRYNLNIADTDILRTQ